MSDWRTDPAWPDVDVVMPIRNEATHLATAIGSVRAQNYPGSMRIILGVGPSTDGTEALAEQLAAEFDDLTVVPNLSGKTPSALNASIKSGLAPVIVRVDGHSELSAGYIRQAVEVLCETGAVNVGGIQRPDPTTPFEQAVADATTSLLGTGGAAYRVGSTARAVDTVYLGVFDRAAVEASGLFDEDLIRNQDYELNIRLRNNGGMVWFDPALSVGYRPRSTWSTLAQQYYEYGWWKAIVLRKHPRSLKLRQLIPPIGIIGVGVGLLIGTRWRPALMIPVIYLIAIGKTAARSQRPSLTACVTVSMHLAWVAGIMVGFGRRP